MDRGKLIGGFQIRNAPTAVARIETVAGRFSIGVQILLDAFFLDRRSQPLLLFHANGNHGHLICDNLRAARDLASREQ
jgi:hypothetical protein